MDEGGRKMVKTRWKEKGKEGRSSCALLVLADGGARKTYRMLSFDSFFSYTFPSFWSILFSLMRWNSNFSLRIDFFSLFKSTRIFISLHYSNLSVTFFVFSISTCANEHVCGDENNRGKKQIYLKERHCVRSFSSVHARPCVQIYIYGAICVMRAWAGSRVRARI